MKNIIAWDLGATNCTVGLLSYEENAQQIFCQKKFKIKLKDTHSLEHLIDQLQCGLDFDMRAATSICIGAAGFYDGETIQHANAYQYPMDVAGVAKKLQWHAYAVIHDYAPIVCATFTSYMQEKNVKYLNAHAMDPHGRRIALGVGTGLGLKDGVLLPNGDFWLGENEVGHIGIIAPPFAELEKMNRHQALMKFLRNKFSLSNDQPITFENILTGQGTVNLYQFFYQHSELTPEEVGIKMRAGETPDLIAAFAWYLGLFIGSMQLAFMPAGGVWITGGVVLNHLDILDHVDFFAGIEASPAYLSQRVRYPLGILCNPEHALMGGAYYAAKRL